MTDGGGSSWGTSLLYFLFSVFTDHNSHVISSPFHLHADDLRLYKHFELTELSKTLICLNKILVAVKSLAEAAS